MPSATLPPGLLAAVRQGQVAHAYLFCGSAAGGAAEQVAVALAQTLNCASPQGIEPCGRCSVCLRIADGVHPDVRVVAPAGGTVGIEQVRTLVKDLMLRPMEGPWRIFLVLAADHLSSAGANRLLKVLEEPPAQTVLILAVESPTALPATILSRCQTITVGVMPATMIVEGLAADAGLGVDTARYLARLAGSDGAVANHLLEVGAAGELRDRIIAAAEKLGTGDPLALLAAADLLAGSGDQIEVALLVWDALWRDLKALQIGVAPEQMYHCDLADKLAAMARELPPVDLEGLLRGSAQLRAALASRVGRQLACDAALIRMGDVLLGRVPV